MRFLFGHDCKRHGHRFEARYDKEVKLPNRMTSLAVADAETLRDAFMSGTYIHDLCPYCGTRIDRDGNWIEGRPAA